MKLLTSCQGLDGSDNNEGLKIADSLDRVKSIYAARLALCELSEAGAPIPPACLSIRIVSDRKHNESSVALVTIADDFPPIVVEGCLRGLESRPQWWTSYSNSRQNAIIICQAARIEIEKEEMINIQQSLSKTTADLNSALQAALHDAASENAQNKAFMETVYELRNQLKTELQEERSQAKKHFASLLHDFESTLGMSASNVLSLLSSVEADTAALTQVRITFLLSEAGD